MGTVANAFCGLMSFNPQGGSKCSVIPILQMRKSRPRKAACLAQGHMASMRRSWGTSPHGDSRGWQGSCYRVSARASVPSSHEAGGKPWCPRPLPGFPLPGQGASRVPWPPVTPTRGKPGAPAVTGGPGQPVGCSRLNPQGHGACQKTKGQGDSSHLTAIAGSPEGTNAPPWAQDWTVWSRP